MRAPIPHLFTQRLTWLTPIRIAEGRSRKEALRCLYVSCQVCKSPPAWFRASYPATNCGCSVVSSLRSSFAREHALK